MSQIDRIATPFASLGPIGKLPAPGTWGSLIVAVLAPFLFMPAPLTARLLILVLLFLSGSFACDIVERNLGQKDPSQCIIDEVLGQWVTYCFFAALTPFQFLLGLLLFRAFDIWKPQPIRASENWLEGGLGVMLDDVLAGVFAAIALWILITIGL